MRPEGPPKALVDQPGLGRIRFGVDPFEHASVEVLGTSEGAGQLGGLSGAPEEVGARHPARSLGVGYRVPELERPLELSMGFGVRIGIERGDARHDRGVDRALLVSRGEPVMGDLCQAAGSITGIRSGFELRRDRGVKSSTVAGQERVVHGFTHQRMPERVSLRIAVDFGHEEPGRRRLVEARQELALVQVRDRGQQVVVDPSTGHGSRAEQAVRVLADAGQPGPEHFGEGHRQSPIPGARGEQLLGEEGIPFRAAPDGVRDRAIKIAAQDGGELPHHLVAIQPRELDPFDAGDAVDLGQPGQEGVAAVELVTTEGRNDEQPLIANVADEKGEEFPSRVVGPMDVLDDEHDHPLLAEPTQQVEQRLVQAAPRPFGPQLGGIHRSDRRRPHESEVGGDRTERVAGGRRPATARAAGFVVVEGPDQRADGFDDRAERERALRDPDTSAAQHECTLGPRALGRLADQPGLADACLTADEHDPGAACRRVGERVREDL